jgi:hypothetical protein
MSSGTVKVALVDTGTYTYSATHEFLSSLTGRVGTDATLGTKTFTNGTFDAANSTYTSVSGATVEALVDLHRHGRCGHLAPDRLHRHGRHGPAGHPERRRHQHHLGCRWHLHALRR